MHSNEYAKCYLELLLNSRKEMLESFMQKPISGEEYVIEYLAEHPGPVSPSELSRNMQASTARVAAILRHLECFSLILRDEDIGDGRRHPVELSRAGAKLATEIHEKRLATVSKIFDAIGEEETKDFIRITEHIMQVCRGMEATDE